MPLKELLSKEDIKIEWKRELPRPESLAKEMVAFANSDGGSIVIGVDNDGKIVGTNNIDEEHVINIARNNCIPPVKLEMNNLKKEGKQIVEIKVHRGEDSPYSANHRYYIRIGNTVRDASIEELIRLVVRGNHKGTVLLLSNMKILQKKIRAGIHSRTKQGRETATQKIIELCELIHETHDSISLKEGFDVLLDVSREAAMNNSELTQRIIEELDGIALVIEICGYYEQIKATKIVDILFEILDDIEEYRPRAVKDIELSFSLLQRIAEASIKSNDYDTINKIKGAAKYFKRKSLIEDYRNLVEFINDLTNSKGN